MTSKMGTDGETLDAAGTIITLIVAIITAYYGCRAGLLTALASALVCKLFFFEPLYSSIFRTSTSM